MEAAYISRNDLFFLYTEIFEQRSYLQQGILLCSGAVVLDVGANVGLFAVFASGAVGEKGRVIAAEPVPAIFEALEYNVASHAKQRGWYTTVRTQVGRRGLHPTAKDKQARLDTNRAGDTVAPIQTLNAGVGDGTSGDAEFTFYPRAAGWSSMRPDPGDIFQAMDVFLERSFQAGNSSLPAVGLASLGRLLRRLLPVAAFRALTRLFVGYMLGQQQAVCCKLVTVSDIITSTGLQRVDLLKVDVERAELEVLRGVEDRHWPLVEQIAVEVHDVDGRLAAVEALLGAKGFRSIVSRQADELRGSQLFNLYGVR